MLSVKKRGINNVKDNARHPELVRDDMRLIFILFKGILSALL